MAKSLFNLMIWTPLLLAGCAQTTEVNFSATAEIPTGRTQRIAVLNMDGSEEHARAATERLIQRLTQSGKYEIVGEQTLQQAAPEALRDGRGRLRKQIAGQAGRNMRLDALLVSNLATRDSRKEGRLRFGYPVVSATSSYTWVELPSGRLRDAQQAQHGETVKGGGADAMQRSVEQSVDKLTANLAPNLRTTTYELAGGKWFGALSQGNRHAAKRDWQAAEAAWTEVTESDPENEAAWYNLGIAAEVRRDYRLAQERFRRAAQIEAREEYSEALARVERSLRSEYLAGRQAAPASPSGRYAHHPPHATRAAAYHAGQQSHR